jgi:hypothetical protein
MAIATQKVAKSNLLGHTLVEQGLITAEKLQEALLEHKRSGRQLGRVLVESGAVTEEQVARTVAGQLTRTLLGALLGSPARRRRR